MSEEGCECGAEPSCLLFSGQAYLAQCRAMEELFEHFLKLTITLPSEAQFMHVGRLHSSSTKTVQPR